jgi:Asp-tRNA(Asn)/Glu-tRNA(Gln) amidotransferase A subunit family amidase
MSALDTLPAPALMSYQSGRGGVPPGRDTPTDQRHRALARLEEWEPRLHAFAALSVQRARVAADAATARWREGRPVSRVDGMPVGVKDVIDAFDLPTGAGSPAFDGFRPRHDSAAVHALRGAGAALVGKTTTTELALTYPADTRNPHDLTRTPGGSSSGSAAAVGAGILPVALGTQAIGSVLRPASFCGAYGYKPTFGAVNRGGTRDFHSQSCLGFLGAGLADLWYTAHEVATRAGGDPGYPGPLGGAGLPEPATPRAVALLRTEGWDAAAEPARAGLDAFLTRAGVTVLDQRGHQGVAALERGLASALARGRDIINYESQWLVDALADRDPTALSPVLLARIDSIRHLTPDDYRALLGWRDGLRATFDEVMHDADAVVTLSAPGKAPAGLTGTGDATFTVPSSLLGAPAVSLPVLADDGLPLGLQLIGGRHRDEPLFGTARWAEGVAARL